MNKLKKLQKKSTVKPPDPFASITSVQAKFKRVKQIRAELAKLKVLYQEHDRLMEELIPLFVTKENDRFVVARQITLGAETYKVSAYFYDEKKGELKSKAWKSTAHETFTIE
jgi:hypothetical protein